MFVLLIVLQICLARLQALGWLEVSSTGLLIHFGPDYLKQVLMVDHKKGDQKCMVPHRVVGQKKNPVTSAPFSCPKHVTWLSTKSLPPLLLCESHGRKRYRIKTNTSVYDTFHNVPLFWHNCLNIVTLETLSKIYIPGLFRGFEYFWHYQPPPAPTSMSNLENRASKNCASSIGMNDDLAGPFWKGYSDSMTRDKGNTEHFIWFTILP